MTVIFNEYLVNQMQQPPKSSTWIGSKISFIKAKAGNTDFYIAAAEDEPELISIRCT